MTHTFDREVTTVRQPFARQAIAVTLTGADGGFDSAFTFPPGRREEVLDALRAILADCRKPGDAGPVQTNGAPENHLTLAGGAG